MQLAKLAGAHVVATAGPRSAAAVRALGADEVVDYTTDALPGGNDVLINLVPDLPASVTELAEEFVSITQPIVHPHAVRFVARNDPGQLTELVALIDKGLVDVEAVVRPLESLADLHREAERGLVRGKVVLTVEPRRLSDVGRRSDALHAQTGPARQGERAAAGAEVQALPSARDAVRE
ncbi:zinc-binding dehydrogenase [Microbispora sp. CA-135349]|uniref:zinc-binding dehydrogenase n=1 Tax=Microbispora sp. CA-135349 TaxID=3239953 RepID=UPI003D91046B